MHHPVSLRADGGICQFMPIIGQDRKNEALITKRSLAF